MGGGGGAYRLQGPTKIVQHLYVSSPPDITNWLLFIYFNDSHALL